MFGDPVEMTRRLYGLWNEGEMDGFLELVHPDFVYTTSGTFPGFEPDYRGRQGMVAFRDTMFEAWTAFDLQPTAITAQGDHVVAALRFVGSGRISGVEVTAEFHHVAHFRDGLIYRLVSHPDREAALAAAGLDG